MTIQRTIDLDAGTVTFHNEAKKTVFQIADFPAQTQRMASLRGLKDGLEDAAAGAAKVAKEKGLVVDDVAFEMILKRANGMLEGWTPREAGEGAPREPAVNLEVLADVVASVRRKDRAKVFAALTGLREGKKHAAISKWKNEPDILPAYAKALAKANGATVQKMDDTLFD